MRYSDFKKIAAGEKVGANQTNQSPAPAPKAGTNIKTPDGRTVTPSTVGVYKGSVGNTPANTQWSTVPVTRTVGNDFDVSATLNNTAGTMISKEELARRGAKPVSSVPVFSTREENNQTIAAQDTANQWAAYVRDYEQKHNGQLPANVAKDENGRYFVQTPEHMPVSKEEQRQAVVADLKARQAKGEMLSAKQLQGFTEEELADINSTRQQGLEAAKKNYQNKDFKPQQRDLDAMTADEREQVFGNRYSAGGFVASDTFKAPLAPGETYKDRAQALIDSMHDRVEEDYHWLYGGLSRSNSDAENFDIWMKENPEAFNTWFNSLESAFTSSNIDALTELQKMAVPGEGGTPSKLNMLPPEYRARLQKAGKEAAWKAVEDNPININKAIGLWLRQNGHGGMADFVSDSVYFYGSLAALLAGGVALGGMFGGDDDNDNSGYQVGGPRYNPQEPDGYNRIPYA